MEENKSMMERFVDCLRNSPDGAFDFIANEYYKFSKDELKDICKELLYAVYYVESREYITEDDSKAIYECAANELEERYIEE